MNLRYALLDNSIPGILLIFERIFVLPDKSIPGIALNNVFNDKLPRGPNIVEIFLESIPRTSISALADEKL